MNSKSINKSTVATVGSWRHLLSYWIALALLSILAAGCAFRDVRTLSLGQPPSDRPVILVMGPVVFADNQIPATDKETYRLRFEEGMRAWFSRTNNMGTAVVSSTNANSRGIILSGTITEVNKGNAAEMYFVGMGLGEKRIQGDFEIKDAAGNSLTRFSARKSYQGGLGIGGAAFLSMGELSSQLGGTVAKTVSNWLQGRKIE